VFVKVKTLISLNFEFNPIVPKFEIREGRGEISELNEASVRS
jgi:hypothetical protein